MQHVKLVPADGGATLVAGSVHLIERTAELRTLEFLDVEHQRRFARSTLSPPPAPSARIDGTLYEELLDRLRGFCVEQDWKVSTADAERGTPTMARTAPARPRPQPRWLLILALLVFVGTIALVFATMRSR